MVEVGHKCKLQTSLDSFGCSSKTPNDNAMVFQQEPEQGVGAAPAYFASEEEEATWVQHLLAEPEYDGIINILLDHNACDFSVPKSYYFTDFSATEPVLIKSDHDALQGSFTEEDKTREKFLDGLSNGYDANYCSISCDGYLLDTELKEETPTFHDVTRDISCIGDLKLENQLADSVGRNCDIDVSRLSDASTSYDHDILQFDDHNYPQFDDMSTDKLLKVFSEMFGWETSIADKQWNITFCMQNQDLWQKNFNFPNCSINSTENEGAKVTPASHENLLTASTAFASVFNFRTKRRVQHVRRREYIQWNSNKGLSSAPGETQFDSPEKAYRKIMPLLYTRSCQPSMWRIKVSAEENVKCDERKLEFSERNWNCKPSRRGFGPRYYHEGANISLRGVDEISSQVECVQIPSGEDKLIRVEGHLSECKGNRSHDSNIHAAKARADPSYTLSDESYISTSEDDWIIETDPLSDNSNDTTSEDDRIIGTGTRFINRYRKHKYWSIHEVVKLVEGVSKYGVGRWTDIRKIFFRSYVHRSPADLKDKWRNLVNASSRRSQRQRGVDKTKKRGSPSLPQHV